MRFHLLLLHLGASFFYLPGSVPYEAHEVRAFGLLLEDLVSRTRTDVATFPPDQDSYGVLQDVVLLCIDNNITAAQRPSFGQLYAQLQK